MAGKFTSAEVADTSGILDAIYSIASSAPGLDISFGKKAAMPEIEEIRKAGDGINCWPYLVVLIPRRVGSEKSGGISSGIFVYPDVRYPAFDYDVHVLFPKGDVTPEVYLTPDAALNALEAAFTVNYSLLQTCDHASVESLGVVEIETVKGSNYLSAKVTIRALVQLIVDNTPA